MDRGAGNTSARLQKSKKAKSYRRSGASVAVPTNAGYSQVAANASGLYQSTLAQQHRNSTSPASSGAPLLATPPPSMRLSPAPQNISQVPSLFSVGVFGPPAVPAVYPGQPTEPAYGMDSQYMYPSQFQYPPRMHAAASASYRWPVRGTTGQLRGSHRGRAAVRQQTTHTAWSAATNTSMPTAEPAGITRFDEAAQSSDFSQAETIVGRPVSGSYGRRSRQLRCGRYNRSVNTSGAKSELSSAAQSANSPEPLSEVAKTAGAKTSCEHDMAITRTHLSSAPPSFDCAVARRAWRGGGWNRRRGHARAWYGGRVISAPSAHHQSSCSNQQQEQQMEEGQPLVDVASSVCGSESGWGDSDDDSGEPDATRAVSRRVRSMRQRGHGRCAGASRGGRGRYRKPVGEAVGSSNSEAAHPVSGTAASRSETCAQDVHSEEELVSNADTSEWVDDGNDDDDKIEGEILLVSCGEKQRVHYSRGHAVGRGRGRAGKIHALPQGRPALESKESTSTANSVLKEASKVGEKGTTADSDSSKPNTHQKKSKPKQKTVRPPQVPEFATNESDKRPLSAALSGDTPAVQRTSDDSVKLKNKARHNAAHQSDNAKNIPCKRRINVDENLLFWYIVNNHDGKCYVDELQNHIHTSNDDEAIDCLRRLKRIKILVNESDKWKSVAFVYLKRLRMCMNAKTGCKSKKCEYLHLCNDFITESCRAGQHCHSAYGHNVRTPCNESCLEACGIPASCSHEALLAITRCSNLLICAGHNGLGDAHFPSPDQCTRIHVCNDFFIGRDGRCLIPDSQCSLGHDLTSSRNTKLFAQYEVTHLLKDDKLATLRRMILPVNKKGITVSASSCKAFDENKVPLRMLTTPQTDLQSRSASVAVVRPSTRSEELYQSADREMTNNAACTLNTVADPSVAQTARSISFRVGQKPVTLKKFLVESGQTSSAGDNAALTSSDLTHVSHHDEIGLSGHFASLAGHSSTYEPTGIPQPGKIAEDKSVPLYNSDVAHEAVPEQMACTMPASLETNRIPRFGSRHSLPSSNELKLSSSQCLIYVKHSCNAAGECSARHDVLPYLWRLQDAGQWVPFEDSVKIEEEFCNPYKTTCSATYQGVSYVIDFDAMSCAFGPVQRLSTPSYVACRYQSDATRWCWYWDDGNSICQVWIMYEDVKPPYQDVLESRYLADAHQTCCFELDMQYELDFDTMKQKNIITGNERAVCRRPYFVSADDIRTGGIPPALFHFHQDKLPINEGWSPMDTETLAWTDLIPLSQQHALCVKVRAEFHATLRMNDFKICRIYRVQNLELWNKYQNMKCKMEQLEHLKSLGAGERKLFHGTPEEATVRCICYQNFDPRMHGAHATMFGKGAYFSTTAQYSDQYTRPCPRNKGRKYMFFARVLVGKWSQGSQDLQRPPPVDPARLHGALFDSCVNNTSNPTIFVVFDNHQCYPEFLIEYEACEKPAIDIPYSGYYAPVIHATNVPVTTASQQPAHVSVAPAFPSHARVQPSQHQGASYRAATGYSSVSTPVTAAASQSQPSSSSSQTRTAAPSQEAKKGCIVM